MSNRSIFISAIILLFGLIAGWRITDSIAKNATARENKPTPRTFDTTAEYIEPAEERPARKKRTLTEEEILQEIASRKNERIAIFENDDAYRKALEKLKNSGIRILGQNDRLNALRLGYDDLDQLRELLGDDANLGNNFLVFTPGLPPESEIQPGAVGFGNNTLAFLGVDGDNSAWGQGVTIAIIDTGVAPHPAIPEDFREISLLENEAGELNGHGTAVASLASLIAPAADILSIRVAGTEGTSDSFTLAQGIISAVDGGADIINISLGSQFQSPIITDAITYATENGVAIVASAGNNAATEAASPASDPRVFSVGAIDANGNHLDFSHTSDTLSLTAPGLEVFAAFPGDQGIAFTGTSASSPLAAGAIAAVLSEDPSSGTPLTAAQTVLDHTNEAGAPNADPFFGNGTLDVGRAINHNTSGIVDLAVASHFFLFDTPDNQPGLQVSVENRGTETVTNALANILVGDEIFSTTVPSLVPNQRHVIFLPEGLQQLESTGSLNVSSSINLQGTRDQKATNNSRSDVITLSQDADLTE